MGDSWTGIHAARRVLRSEDLRPEASGSDRTSRARRRRQGKTRPLPQCHSAIDTCRGPARRHESRVGQSGAAVELAAALDRTRLPEARLRPPSNLYELPMNLRRDLRRRLHVSWRAKLDADVRGGPGVVAPSWRQGGHVRHHREAPRRNVLRERAWLPASCGSPYPILGAPAAASSSRSRALTRPRGGSSWTRPSTPGTTGGIVPAGRHGLRIEK